MVVEWPSELNDVERLAVLPLGPVVVAVTSPVPRPVTVRSAVWPFGPVTVVELPPGENDVERLAVLPFGPAPVTLVWPSPRVTVRVATPPFGPIATWRL